MTIRLMVQLAIRPGRREAFHEAIAKAAAAVRQNEPGALAFEAYVGDDDDVVFVHEAYRDAEAYRDHRANMNSTRAGVMDHCDLVWSAITGPLPQEIAAGMTSAGESSRWYPQRIAGFRTVAEPSSNIL